MHGYDAVKTFSTSNRNAFADLGAMLSNWVQNVVVPCGYKLLNCTVMQSSDANHHCLSFIVFYRKEGRA